VNSPWSIITELEQDNSRLAKEAIISREAEAGNDEFFDGCRLALDSLVTFNVKKILVKEQDGRGLSWPNFQKLATALSTRQVTGNDAISLINQYRLQATQEQWNNWYRRILIKDLRCGTSEKTINSVVKKLKLDHYKIPVFTCQLAHDSANHEKKVAGNKIVEVKLDGVRVITIVYPNGTVNQYSRNGKELVNFEHIKKQIAKHARFFSEPMVLDGEVMSNSFQDLMKQVHRKTAVEATDAVLHLFDIITLKEFQRGHGDRPQTVRSDNLLSWYGQWKDHMPNVSVVGQIQIDLDSDDGREKFKDINQQAIDGGYEGIMIKDLDAVYECKRSHSWLKLKPFIEVTLEVVDVEEGTGRNAGRLGALICKGEDDGLSINVNCGSGFTDSDRDSFWNTRTELLGRMVEVRADAVTKNQDETYSLRFPRFKGFRGFEVGEKL